MRTSRLATSTPDLDAAEEEWWDRFSPVSERFWVLEPDVASALRAGYLDRAADYLRSTPTQGRVLDLGCGSGFVSQHLAARGLDVLGVDISGEQIGLARRFAQGKPGEDRMEFRVGDASGTWAEGERFGGLVTHAFLHHLAKDELAQILADARGLLEPGAKAWFFEPVFYRPGRRGPSGLWQEAQSRALRVAGKTLRKRTKSHQESVRQLQEFEAEAQRCGYFLSPKEVPFTADELISELSRHFELQGLRWENTISYQLASDVNLLSNRRARSLGATAVRGAATIDGRLGAKGNLDRYRGMSGYGFASSFCQVAEAGP